MRSLLEIQDHLPLTFDVLAWVPCPVCEGRGHTWKAVTKVVCKCIVGGSWQRHSIFERIPTGPGVMYPTDAYDLMTIFPTATVEDLAEITYRAIKRRVRSEEGVPNWAKAWKLLRRHIKIATGEKSAGTIPTKKDYFYMRNGATARAKKDAASRKGRSGVSSPVGGARATLVFHVLYIPNHVEDLDVKFCLLAPREQAVMRALLDAVSLKKTADRKLTRPEVFRALQRGEWVKDSGSWKSFILCRAKLTREGFLGEEYPPSAQRKGLTGLKPPRTK